MKMINKKLFLLGLTISATILTTQVVSAAGDPIAIDQSAEAVEPSAMTVPETRSDSDQAVASKENQEQPKSVVEEQSVIPDPQITPEEKRARSEFKTNLIERFKQLREDMIEFHCQLDEAILSGGLKREILKFINESSHDSLGYALSYNPSKDSLEDKARSEVEKAKYPVVSSLKDALDTFSDHATKSSSLIINRNKNLYSEDYKKLLKYYIDIGMGERLFFQGILNVILEDTKELPTSHLISYYLGCAFLNPEVWVEKHDLTYLQHDQLMLNRINDLNNALQADKLELAQQLASDYSSKLSADYKQLMFGDEFNLVPGFFTQDFQFSESTLKRSDFWEKMNQIRELMSAVKPTFQTRSEFERIKAIKINKLLVELESEPIFQTSGFVVPEHFYQSLGIWKCDLKKPNFKQKMCKIIDVIYSKKPFFQTTEKFENDKKAEINRLQREIIGEVVF